MMPGERDEFRLIRDVVVVVFLLGKGWWMLDRQGTRRRSIHQPRLQTLTFLGKELSFGICSFDLNSYVIATDD